MIFFRAELEREAGGRIFNAAEGTETRNQVCKQFFSRSMVINLLGRWKILATMDLPSHPARLAHVGLLATRQVLLSNRAQALEQPSSSSTLDSNDVVETNGGKWVWSEASQKWEWEAEAGAHQVCSLHHSRSHFRNSFEAKFV